MTNFLVDFAWKDYLRGMKAKQIPISKFKAHCTEELRAVEEEGVTLEITRHGKVIAVAHAPEPKPQPGSILGAGIGYARLGENYDPHKPAIPQEEWDSYLRESEAGS